MNQNTKQNRSAASWLAELAKGRYGEYALSVLTALLGVACSLIPYFIIIQLITALVNSTAELFHGPGVTGAGRLDHCKGQRLLISGLLHSAIPPVSLVLMVSSVLVLCRWTALRDIPMSAPISPSASSMTQCRIKILCSMLGSVAKTAWRRPPVGRHAFNCWE